MTIMHIGRGFWANLLKGGDAKLPVYGTDWGDALDWGAAASAESYDSGAARLQAFGCTCHLYPLRANRLCLPFRVVIEIAHPQLWRTAPPLVLLPLTLASGPAVCLSLSGWMAAEIPVW